MSSARMQTWLEIDAARLRKNYLALTSVLGSSCLAPVIKSNAYGHGMSEIYRCLAPLNPPWFCVNYVHEGAALRQLGYQGRVLVLGPGFKDDLPQATEQKLDLVLTGDDHLSHWLMRDRKPIVHLKFDTGMSRQGFMPEDVAAVAASLRPYRENVVGVCSHFANVEDVLKQDYAEQQCQSLLEVSDHLKGEGYSLLRHIASSASALVYKKSRLELARVGISLFGFWPSQATKLSYSKLNESLLPLKPVLQWKAKIAMTKSVPKGAFIGYGCTYRAVKDMRVAVLPVGYFEGYPRLAGGGKSHVLIHGQRAPVVGRICMNMMMVDVSHIAKAKAEDTVVLIGHDGSESIEAEEVAAWAETIHYELVTRIHPDIARVVVNEEDRLHD